jgi:hypothetical protein
MIRILIADNIESHYNAIISAINSGYGSDISDQIQVYPNLELCLAEANTNNNIISIVRSYSGVSGVVSLLSPLYNRVLGFYPLGSNTFQQLNVFTNEEPPVIVTSGAGDLENQNNTGYGKGLEFWDWDLTNDFPEDSSSFSNGYIAGKLLKIKDTLQCSWWEARYRARATALQTETNRLNLGWDLYNGYGKIDVDKAIAYKGVIPLDPYIYNDDYITGLQSDILDLTSDNETLTSENLALTEENETLETQLALFELVENVEGFQISKVTDYGTLTAGKISDVQILDNKVRCKVDYFINTESLVKQYVYSENVEFYERKVIDYIYKHFCIKQEISEDDLIT